MAGKIDLLDKAARVTAWVVFAAWAVSFMLEPSGESFGACLGWFVAAVNCEHVLLLRRYVRP